MLHFLRRYFSRRPEPAENIYSTVIIESGTFESVQELRCNGVPYAQIRLGSISALMALSKRH